MKFGLNINQKIFTSQIFFSKKFLVNSYTLIFAFRF
jgi:hypothetical protein